MRKRPSLQEVLRHREQLVARAEAQRGRIAENLGALRRAASWVDRGFEAAAYLRAHPLALAATGLLLLVALRRPLFGGGLLAVARRGFLAWRTILALRAVALKLAR